MAASANHQNFQNYLNLEAFLITSMLEGVLGPNHKTMIKPLFNEQLDIFMVYDSVVTRRNTNQWKVVFLHTLRIFAYITYSCIHYALFCTVIIISIFKFLSYL